MQYRRVVEANVPEVYITSWHSVLSLSVRDRLSTEPAPLPPDGTHGDVWVSLRNFLLTSRNLPEPLGQFDHALLR